MNPLYTTWLLLNTKTDHPVMKEYVPATRSAHEPADVMLVPVWYNPLQHRVQLAVAVWPSPVWYVQARHKLHVLANVPARH